MTLPAEAYLRFALDAAVPEEKPLKNQAPPLHQAVFFSRAASPAIDRPADTPPPRFLRARFM